MTEEIIKSITDAEAQAAEMKRAANERAANILSDAETQAARLKQSSLEVCKAYRDSQLKAAHSDAENAYAATLNAKEREAREYCAKVLAGSETSVNKIVGRITGGNS